MAYFTKLGVGDVVESVVVVNDDIATSEQAGIDFLNTTYKTNDVWRQTYIDGSQRKYYAGLGHSYDKERDAFIAPQPYPSWALNEDTCRWDAPTSRPDDDKKYYWDEDTTSWKEIE